MAKRLQFRRLLLLAGLLGGAFMLLACRMVELQVVRHEEFRARAQGNTVREFRIQPRRGDILDVHGNLLASSMLVKTVCADPSMMSNRQAEVARTIAPILQLNEGEVYQKLLPRTLTNRMGKVVVDQYVVLKNKVPLETWEKVRAAMTNLTFGVDEKQLPAKEKAFYRNLRKYAVYADPVSDQLRIYPHRSLAAHVLGYVGRNGDTNSAEFGQLVGMDGIERLFNKGLSGVSGWRVTELDSGQRELVALREQDVAARDGLNVVLTIDSVIQDMLEEALADGLKKHSPANISGIVVRPRTGEILAMATLPSYDPNQVPREPELRRNRIVTDQYEPGSTFKIVVVSGALEDRVVSLRDMIDCEKYGAFTFGGRTLHDSHGGHGLLSVENVITKSSNIGAAKIGIKLGERRLYDYMCAFGFGMPSGIQLPAETGGVVKPVDEWSKVTIAQIPMGHGVAVTRLQMTMAMAALANNGNLMRPMLVTRVQDAAGHVITQFQPQQVRQVVSPATAQQMVKALKTVVGPGGTARLAAMTNYLVAGKTGTAQKPSPKGGYSTDKFFASFIGFFPADNPEVCISIILDEPKGGHMGGEVAAPVFRQLAEGIAQYLTIRQDVANPALDAAAPTPGDLSDARAKKMVVAKTSQTP